MIETLMQCIKNKDPKKAKNKKKGFFRGKSIRNKNLRRAQIPEIHRLEKHQNKKKRE